MTREVGSIREFDNERYELLEDNIVPESKKKSFIVKLNIFTLIPTILLLILALAYFQEGTINFILFFALMFGFFVYIVVHELLHGITFTFDENITWKNIKFGAVIKSGMAYCISKKPVKVSVSRLSLMMPVYVICIPMIILGVILNNAVITIFGILYLSGSAGDFYYMWKIRKASKDLYMYEEMPSKSGYEVGYLLFKKLN